MKRTGIVVVALAIYAGVLFWSAGSTRIGGGLLDPIGGVRAQDEAAYSHVASGMVRNGDWLTPRFLGRPFLYKPPLLYWASGASISLLGESPRSFRLPSILAAAAGCGVVFWWVWGSAGAGPALLAFLLVAGHPLWISMGQRNMTDALLAAFLVAAAWQLWRHGSRAGPAFAMTVAAAILVKSVAGLLPLAIYGVIWALEPKSQRAGWRHMAGVAAWITILTLPWFAYQVITHPRWLWEEFVNVEILAWGLGSPPQTSEESAAIFYGRRLFAMDPMFCVIAAAGCIWTLRRAAGGRRVMLIAWISVCSLAFFAYSYRNVTYLLPLIPALAVAAGLHVPRRLALVLALVCAAKAAFLWPTAHAPEQVFYALESYCSERRANETVIVSAADQFYSTLLPLRNLRYAFAESEFPSKGFAMDFRAMGIAVTVDEFLNLDTHVARYRNQLSRWGVRGSDPIASVVLYRDQADLERLIRGRSHADFILADDKAVSIRYGDRLTGPVRQGPCRM